MVCLDDPGQRVARLPGTLGRLEGAMALVRDLSPLLNLLKPEGTTSVAVLQKATRLVHLLYGQSVEARRQLN